MILERLPRADDLADLSEYANFALRVLAEKSKLKNRIFVSTMQSLNFSNDDELKDIFGHPNSRSFDGIHPRGKHGRRLLNESIITAFKQAGMTASRQVEQGQEPITISNRFNVLN